MALESTRTRTVRNFPTGSIRVWRRGLPIRWVIQVRFLQHLKQNERDGQNDGADEKPHDTDAPFSKVLNSMTGR